MAIGRRSLLESESPGDVALKHVLALDLPFLLPGHCEVFHPEVLPHH